MRYNIADIEKIAEFKSWNDRQKINELLRIDCNMYTNIGVDSTKTQKETAKKNSRKIHRLIKGIDYKMGNDFLVAMDR